MNHSRPDARRAGAGRESGAPLALRLLLLAYPNWFRKEYRNDLVRYLTCQRGEGRYRSRPWGALRFWWHALKDAVRTGLRLRLDRRRGRSRRPGGSIARGKRSGTGHSPAPRVVRRSAVFDALVRDFRGAIRGLIQNPGYAAVFILTLGLGIGANAAIFSAVNGVLLQPLPHEGGDRLVYLRHAAPRVGIDNALFSVPEIDDYRRGASSLAAVAEFSALDFTLRGLEAPLRVRAGIVTANYFEVMGLSAALGRVIGPEDGGADAPPVIVLAHAYWRGAFQSDPEIVGQRLEVNGRIATIVGVAEPAPPYPERTDIYVNMATSPHHLAATMTHDRVHRMTEIFARLEPGGTVEDARVEVEAITARMHDEHPEAYDPGSGFVVTVTPLKMQLTSRARPTLLLLLCTALLVLIIACANLANLTLARVLRREQELAIRVSLGGSRLALRRGLLVESLVLAGAGAVLGLAMASVGLDLLVAFTARFSARASEITLDTWVLGFALASAVGASLFFTLLPPLPNAGRAADALASGGTRTTMSSGGRRAQRLLVVAQIGVSFVLLVGAGLLTRTLVHLDQVEPGFDTEQVLSLDIPVSIEDGRSSAEMRSQSLAVVRGIRGLPGVENAALTSSVPFRNALGISTRFEMDVEGHEPAAGEPTPRADFRVVTPGYFATMGIRVVSGRAFVSTDVHDGQPVVIINEATARAYFGDRDPVGGRIAWTDELFKFMGLAHEWRTVVGVVADTREGGLDTEPTIAIYNPYGQVAPQFTRSMVVRLQGGPAALLPSIRETILAHDPQQTISDVAMLSELSEESVAPRRLNTLLLSSFALLALLIAAVGIGGVLAFSVGSRRQELGVRSALGAARHRILRGVLADGARLAAAGIGIGGLVALIAVRFLSGLLVGVPALDPVTFLIGGFALLVVALVAAWVPAWRAAAVSPMEAMTSE